MKNLSSIINNLQKAESAYTGAIGKAEERLSEYINFDFFIVYQPSDGFVIGDSNGNNAPLSSCISIINEEGILNHESYKNETI